MSRGRGIVQRRLIEAIQGEPCRLFAVEELAEIAFPGELVERKHAVSVRRALKSLPGLDLYRAGRSSTPVGGVTCAACWISVASCAGGCTLEFAKTRAGPNAGGEG